MDTRTHFALLHLSDLQFGRNYPYSPAAVGWAKEMRAEGSNFLGTE